MRITNFKNTDFMRESRHFVLFLLLMIGGGLSLSAQNRVVTGKVFDAEQYPMIGVTVQLDGTSRGVISSEDGSFALHTLSEGEVTFITFLYYLQLAKGSTNKETITNDRILVIDDPISSLDSNILFIVSTLVKNIIDDIKANKGCAKQLILLTHNVYFHKEVSFIDSRQRESKEAHYWILRKNGIITKIQYYGTKNPIQSSYSLLWEEYKNDSITSTLTIQNIMRRIIENYFKLLGKYGDDKLINKFDNNEEREICKSLISWINDGSHSIHDDLFIEIPTLTIETYRKVFKDIFEKSKHISHYNMMMGIEE